MQNMQNGQNGQNEQNNNAGNTGVSEKWMLFEKECRECHECGLSKTRNSVVIYRGNTSAPLMVVGEAPGKNEDEQGKPFVGRSGQLLQLLLTTAGFKPDEIHVCNIVKCRPPENRRPTASEILSCKKLLAKQFELVSPKMVLLCGATAYEAFFNQKPNMHEVRGNFIKRGNYYIMTTFHPAYALRDPKQKIPMLEDITAVRTKLTELGILPEVTDFSSEN